MNGWNTLQEELVEVGSVRQFKGRLDSAWLAVCGEDSVKCEVEEMV